MPPTPEELAAQKAADEKAAADKKAADEAALGDAGKKALKAERAAKRDAERKAKAESERADELQKRIEAIEAENQSESEKAIAKATKDAAKTAESETAAKYQRRILESEVLAAAGGKLTTPADAIALLDLEGFDGDADPEDLRTSIGSAIDKLIEDRPYLRAGKVQGKADGGAKQSSASDGKMTPDQRLSQGYEQSSN